MCAGAPPALAGVSELNARGSVEQVQVTGAEPGQAVRLLRGDLRVDSQRAGSLGGVVFRKVEPGRGYRVRQGTSEDGPVRVLTDRSAPPDESIYDQELPDGGYGYLETRDGTELAVSVRLPGPPEDGPYPTVVEYSGYGYADPAGPESGIAAVGNALGYAVVDVNMRGTGCSGGAFDYFETLQSLDGYDVVETVARQDWVANGQVGMIGISYGGISQLFVAATRPPSLAAITPLSVIDNTLTTLYPGGILNTGFALQWAQERVEDAKPASPTTGQPWAWDRIEGGDTTCEANQALHTEAVNLIAKTRRNRYYRPAVADPLSPVTFVDRINVPSFVACQHTDEQTGGHFATSLGRLSRNRKVWISLQNGVHVDSLGPDTLTRWVEFLKLYVADEVPRIPDPVLSLSGSFYKFLADAPASPVAQSRFAGFESAAAARTEFARDPRVRLLMENGAGPAGPGAIGSAWELGYDAWPIRQVRPAWHYFGPNGTLVPEPPGEGAATYTADPRARPAQTLPGSGEADAWKAQPPYRWAPLADGKGVGFVTGALPQDVVIAGPSAVHLRLSSSARDTDLQVTLSEVRPDGNETYVQNGWLRASHRREQGGSTALAPRPTHLRRDARPIPSGEIVTVRVPIFPVAHAFRAGSRIRVTVQGPGGDRPRWRFSSVDRGRTRNVIHFGGLGNRSALVLPVIAGATANGTALPPAAALRGQPSRRYVPAANGG